MGSSQYIPYHDFRSRFQQLNEIARPNQPGLWPNLVAILIFIGLFVAATIGILNKDSGLGIMGQGSCFVLPVLVVLWIRISKESNSRARKKFKHRSQKLLRTWTNQDSFSHQIQWKLRSRFKSSIVLRQQQQQQYALDGTMVQEQDATAVIEMEATISAPGQTLDANSTRRNPVPVDSFLVATLQLPATSSSPSAAPPSAPSPPSPPSQQQRPQRFRSWFLRSLLCLRPLRKPQRVWMIEISIQSGPVDEYALVVPSPVYCDYRLPGYADAMASARGSSTRIPPTAPYVGSPPAYESDSDNESEDEEEMVTVVEREGESGPLTTSFSGPVEMSAMTVVSSSSSSSPSSSSSFPGPVPDPTPGAGKSAVGSKVNMNGAKEGEGEGGQE